MGSEMCIRDRSRCRPLFCSEPDKKANLKRITGPVDENSLGNYPLSARHEPAEGANAARQNSD